MAPIENPYKNQFEKELAKIIKASGYSNISQIYKNFYSQSLNPEKIKNLLGDSKIPG